MSSRSLRTIVNGFGERNSIKVLQENLGDLRPLRFLQLVAMYDHRLGKLTLWSSRDGTTHYLPTRGLCLSRHSLKRPVKLCSHRGAASHTVVERHLTWGLAPSCIGKVIRPETSMTRLDRLSRTC